MRLEGLGLKVTASVHEWHFVFARCTSLTQRGISRSLSVAMQAWDMEMLACPQNPSPVSPKGRSKRLLKQALLWKPNLLVDRIEANHMPSPLGEGQTDTPINRHNRGEVCCDASVE